jgi:MFS family permease
MALDLVLPDVTPLRLRRDFRLLFAGQLVSALGSFLTYVALPVHLFELTRSSAMVGLLGAVQLVPLLATALLGGAVADAFDRRRLLLGCECLLGCGSLALAANAARPTPSVSVVFTVAACMAGVTGFHTPALESLTPRLVEPGEIAAVSALTSLRGTTAAIVGPSIAGVCMAAMGVPSTFLIDAATFVASLVAVASIRAMPPLEGRKPPGVTSIVEGIQYAASRPELVGTYVVDIVALTFAMPMAVFPALASELGGRAEGAGYLCSALSAGAFLATVTSGWTRRVRRHGAAVVIAAASWGLAITALGFARSPASAMACLVVAGGADMVSGLA